MEQELSAEHRRLLTNAKECKREGDIAYKDRVKERLERYWQYYIGDHFAGIDLEEWKTDIPINYCRKVYYQNHSLLTDAPPTVAIYGREQADIEAAKRVQMFLDAKNEEIYMENRRSLAWAYALIFGLCWLKPCIDMTRTRQIGEQRAQGDATVHVIDPNNVRIDPAAAWGSSPMEAVENAEYIYHQELTTDRRLKRIYPHLADQIDQISGVKKEDLPPWLFHDILPGEATGRQEEWVARASGGGTSNTGGNWLETTPRKDWKFAGKRLLVTEMWLRDNDYPNGVVLTMIDDMLLRIQANPYAHTKFPFIPLVPLPIPGRLYGYSIMDIIIPLQDELNKRRGQVSDWMNLQIGPMVDYIQGSIDLDDFVPGPLVKLPRRPGSEPVRLLSPEHVPSDLWHADGVIKEDMRELSGMYETIEGRIKAGTSGVAVEQVQEAALQRIRDMERDNQAAWEEMYRQELSNCQQLYGPTGYVLRITGEQGPQTTLVSQDDLMGRYDLVFKPNSAYTLKRQIWFKQLMDLNAMLKPDNPIPPEELIEVTELPNKDALKHIVKQRLDLIVQLQQMQQELEQAYQQIDQMSKAGGMPPPQVGGPM